MSSSGEDLLLTSIGTLGIPYIVGKNEKFYFKDGNIHGFVTLRNLKVNFYIIGYHLMKELIN
jgi:type I restriction enzyme S subunit